MKRNIMPGDTYPKFTVAAVQAASVWLDRDATILRVDQTPYTYTGVEFTNRSRYDPLAFSEEPGWTEATGEAEVFDPLRGAE